ncbi:MAG TPA: isoprenylcysteine carboxylmethyltransferase family protein [Beijerinckiaceae bacterium]|jgi:methyltransferase
MSLALVVLALVTLQRLGELVLARRNTRALLARGAYEVAGEHYPLIVALHAAWLIGLWALAWDNSVSLPWLGVFVVLQSLRVWVIATLGRRWTTRIIVLPGAPLVTGGPFRFLPHPNYAVVAAELAVLPLAFGLPEYGLLFSVLNALVLFVRIEAEARALAPSREPNPAAQKPAARASVATVSPAPSAATS